MHNSGNSIETRLSASEISKAKQSAFLHVKNPAEAGFVECLDQLHLPWAPTDADIEEVTQSPVELQAFSVQVPATLLLIPVEGTEWLVAVPLAALPAGQLTV